MSKYLEYETRFRIREITKEEIDELLRRGVELRKKMYKEKLKKLLPTVADMQRIVR